MEDLKEIIRDIIDTKGGINSAMITPHFASYSFYDSIVSEFTQIEIENAISEVLSED
jgi:hypothetical protein